MRTFKEFKIELEQDEIKKLEEACGVLIDLCNILRKEKIVRVTEIDDTYSMNLTDLEDTANALQNLADFPELIES